MDKCKFRFRAKKPAQKTAIRVNYDQEHTIKFQDEYGSGPPCFTGSRATRAENTGNRGRWTEGQILRRDQSRYCTVQRSHDGSLQNQRRNWTNSLYRKYQNNNILYCEPINGSSDILSSHKSTMRAWDDLSHYLLRTNCNGAYLFRLSVSPWFFISLVPGSQNCCVPFLWILSGRLDISLDICIRFYVIVTLSLQMLKNML